MMYYIKLSKPSIGVDFASKHNYYKEQLFIKLQIWDSSGQERYKSLIPSYVKGSKVVIIVYDCTSK